MQNTMLDSTISNSLQLFQNTEWKIRVVMRDGEPWFVAKDVCECLDIDNPSQAVARLEDDERCLISNEALRANGDTTVVSEPGLYSLVLGSRKPESKAFKRWVNHEVLPSIRKTGSYSVAQPQPQPVLPTTYLEALEALVASEKAKLALQAERDEAIRTKSMIGSRREATAMAKASAKSKECNRLTAENEVLKDAIGRGNNWRTISMMTAEWKREFGHAPSWQKLKKFSKDLPKEMQPIKDIEEKVVLSNGSEKVNISYRYHMDAWERYRKYEEDLSV